eukprot:COSAG02_NODE_44243_length_368_cov_0.501859_1_plen_23_part_01
MWSSVWASNEFAYWGIGYTGTRM